MKHFYFFLALTISLFASHFYAAVSEPKPWGCDTCSKSFISPNLLHVHSRVHTGERPYACHRCGKDYKQLGGLKYHLSALNGCQKSKKRKIALEVPIETEKLTVKPWGCDTCSKSFISPALLHVHSRVHTGERPYACPGCDKSYKQKNGYDYHIKTTNHLFSPEEWKAAIMAERSARFEMEKKAKQLASFEIKKTDFLAEKELADRYPIKIISQKEAEELRKRLKLEPYALFGGPKQD